MHLRQELAADRDADRLTVVRPQKLRRQAGIFGRRHPDVEAGGDRGGSAGEARRDRAQKPVAPFAAGVDRAEHQQDRQRRAQAPWVAGGEPGSGRSDPQPARRRRHLSSVREPQLRRLRVERSARPVGERLQRAMREPAGPLDAAPGGLAVRHRHAAERRREGQQKPGAERQQQRGMGEAGEERQQIEQRQDQKQAEHGQRRPAGGPDPLPPQRGAGEAQARRKRGREIGRAIGHTAPRFRAELGATASSQSGIVSSASIAS